MATRRTGGEKDAHKGPHLASPPPASLRRESVYIAEEVGVVNGQTPGKFPLDARTLQQLDNLALVTRRAMASGRPGDRKSTRLNSSHPSISYAVFCLKKKKTKR